MRDCRCVPAVKAVKNLVLICPQFSVVPRCGDYRTGEALGLSRLGDCCVLRHLGPEHTATNSIVAEYVLKNKIKSKNKGVRSKRSGRGVYPKLSPELPKLNVNAAGIDIGSHSHYVAIPEGRDERCVREFRSYTSELYAMALWLKECGIETVAMESTGVYWIPVFQVLESL